MSGSSQVGSSPQQTAPHQSHERAAWKPSRLFYPLVPLYAAGWAIRNLAYRHHWLESKQLVSPVVSIGNLSVGGAGKTPLVIRLAELLAARGFAVDVLSRGYGRASTEISQAEPFTSETDTNLTAAQRYGDEPLLIARSTGVPVYVGADRYAAGLVAEERPASGFRVHLLDDGFQHRRLERAVDIVVLHRSDFSALLLPAGRLREPLSALHRASILVLRIEDAAFEPVLRRRGIDLPIWWMTREIIPPAGAALAPAVAFCGIARPSEFFQSLSRAGIPLAARHSFPDHHPYTDADMEDLISSVRTSSSPSLLTTEKDLIRLSERHLSKLREAAAVQAVPLRARLLVEDQAMSQLLELAGLPQLLAPSMLGRNPRGPGPGDDPRFQ